MSRGLWRVSENVYERLSCSFAEKIRHRASLPPVSQCMRFPPYPDACSSAHCVDRNDTSFPRLRQPHLSHVARGLFAPGTLALLLLCLPLRAAAVNPSTPLGAYARQSLVMENGLPQNSVQALAQTRDGFLWIGTEAGLVRFDGVSFQVFDRNSKPSLPGNDIRCLLETSDQALWIGTSDGPARWKDGVVSAFSMRDGLPSNGVRAIIETGDRVLWIWTDLGLARFNGKGFVADTGGMNAPSVTAAFSDARGGLVLETSQKTAVYRDGHWQIEAPGSEFPKDSIAFSENASGEAAGAGNSNLTIGSGIGPPTRLSSGIELPGSRIQALLTDRNGSVWIGTNDGLARWYHGTLQKLSASDPLATASVIALLEDHEGNLWAGTENTGLHIFRDQRFRALGSRGGLTSNQITTVVEDRAGTIWAGTQRDGLNAVHPVGDTRNHGTLVDSTFPLPAGSVQSYSAQKGLASDVILSLAAAPNGDVWAGTPDGLSRLRNGSISTFTSADGLPDDFIRSLLVDSDGSLWIGTRRGLTHWTNAGELDAVGASDANLYRRRRSGKRPGGRNGARCQRRPLGRYARRDFRGCTTAPSPISRGQRAFEQRGDGAVAARRQNLADWDAGPWMGHLGWATILRWPAAPSSRRPFTQFSMTTAGICGLRRATALPGATSMRWLESIRHRGVRTWMTFGTADGLPAAKRQRTVILRHGDRATVFSGLPLLKGWWMLDPAHFPVNSMPPPVALERFAMDDVDQRLHGTTGTLKVAAGHVHFEFDYAGLSFMAPQKVRYRYMLEGFDRGWTDAGTRRSRLLHQYSAGPVHVPRAGGEQRRSLEYGRRSAQL